MSSPADDVLDDDIAARLRAADQRYTTGRRAVVAALRAGGGPMTIPHILELDRSLAQSSVYRNLGVLEQVGVVTRIITRDDHARFELAEDLTKDHHHHLICTECGDVADFSLQAAVESDLDRALHAVARKMGFAAEGHRLDLLGVCADCD